MILIYIYFNEFIHIYSVPCAEVQDRHAAEIHTHTHTHIYIHIYIHIHICNIMIIIYIYFDEFIHIYIAYLAPKFKIVTQQKYTHTHIYIHIYIYVI